MTTASSLSHSGDSCGVRSRISVYPRDAVAGAKGCMPLFPLWLTTSHFRRRHICRLVVPHLSRSNLLYVSSRTSLMAKEFVLTRLSSSLHFKLCRQVVQKSLDNPMNTPGPPVFMPCISAP